VVAMPNKNVFNDRLNRLMFDKSEVWQKICSTADHAHHSKIEKWINEHTNRNSLTDRVCQLPRHLRSPIDAGVHTLCPATDKTHHTKHDCDWNPLSTQFS